MNWFYRMEQKYGRHAIPNLMMYVCIMSVVGYLMMMINPYFYASVLSLDARAILHGQVWRIITFLFYPLSGNVLFMALMVYLYYSLGTTLQNVWGDFKFNIYLLIGVVGHVLAAIILYLLTGYSYQLTPDYMYLSVFIAYALTFPDNVFLIYFILPIKAKYLAWFEMAMFLITFVTTRYASVRIVIVLSLLNVFIFFALTARNHFGGKGKVINFNKFKKRKK